MSRVYRTNPLVHNLYELVWNKQAKKNQTYCGKSTYQTGMNKKKHF